LETRREKRVQYKEIREKETTPQRGASLGRKRRYGAEKNGGGHGEKGRKKRGGRVKVNLRTWRVRLKQRKGALRKREPGGAQVFWAQ